MGAALSIPVKGSMHAPTPGGSTGPAGNVDIVLRVFMRFSARSGRHGVLGCCSDNLQAWGVHNFSDLATVTKNPRNLIGR
jgi:hypothetical protein